jgi:hypothetical protein
LASVPSAQIGEKVSEPVKIGPLVINKITRNLKEFGYTDLKAEDVARQLSTPEEERDVIGMFAAGMLRDQGIEEWIVENPPS